MIGARVLPLQEAPCTSFKVGPELDPTSNRLCIFKKNSFRRCCGSTSMHGQPLKVFCLSPLARSHARSPLARPRSLAHRSHARSLAGPSIARSLAHRSPLDRSLARRSPPSLNRGAWAPLAGPSIHQKSKFDFE